VLRASGGQAPGQHTPGLTRAPAMCHALCAPPNQVKELGHNIATHGDIMSGEERAAKGQVCVCRCGRERWLDWCPGSNHTARGFSPPAATPVLL
jgi:CDGSH-type Zn-finger protein